MTRTHVLAFLALVPAVALAQGAPPSMPSGPAAPTAAPPVESAAPVEPAAPVETAVPLDTRAADAPAEPAARDLTAEAAPDARGVAAPDTYTVKPGDTLWDLSGRFLNNPWYWPKIWSYNPEITNPHWIYPGNILKFFPSAEEAPGRVEPVGPGTPIAQAPAASEAEEEEAAEPVRELEDFSRADMKAPESAEEKDAVAVAGPYKIGFVPSKQRLVRHDTFVTPRELAESGAISAAFEEKIMLSNLDRAYAKFQSPTSVKPGETYVVYRTVRPIYHPVTQELFGYQSEVLGAAKVVAVEEKAATLQISQALAPIERGALLGPWTEKFLRPVAAKPNKANVQGRIIASQVDVVTQMGENHVVFVDKGQADGVEEGNVLTVVRSGDLYDRSPYAAPWDPSLPKEPVGSLLVIDVREKASAALVTRSLKELVIGDRVEMRADAGAGGY